jgi:hypothetical protein
MTREIRKSAVGLAVLPFGWLFQDVRPECDCTPELCLHVFDPHPDQVGDGSVLRCALLAADIGDDHRSVCPDAHLGAVAFSDPGPFYEPESAGEPCNCFPHVRIHEDGNDRRGWDGTIAIHETDNMTACEVFRSSVGSGRRCQLMSASRSSRNAHHASAQAVANSTTVEIGSSSWLNASIVHAAWSCSISAWTSQNSVPRRSNP